MREMNTEPNVTTETITPRTAAHWLSMNGPNRGIDRKTVARYARLMSAGLWVLDGMTIKFDWNGMLLDGQHRLAAVVRSGVTVQSVVVRGLDPASFRSMDRGRLRSVCQTLRMDGVRNGAALAAAALVLHHDEEGALGGSWSLRLEPSEVAAIIEAHPGLSEAVSSVKTGCDRLHCKIGPIAWCYYRFNDIDKMLAKAFFESLFTGESLRRGDPVFLLRERLVANAGSRTKLSPKDVAALVIKAWNATIEGREMRQLKALRRMDGVESFPAISTGEAV